MECHQRLTGDNLVIPSTDQKVVEPSGGGDLVETVGAGPHSVLGLPATVEHIP